MNSTLQLLRNAWGVLSTDPKRRYESKFAVLSALVGRAGLRMYNRHLLWFSDEAFLAVWRRFPEATRAVPDRRFVLLSAAESVRNLPGDTVECGAYRGAGSFLILASQTQIPGKMHHVFDSFEGLSEPDARDDPSKHRTAFLWNKHDLAVGEDVVGRNLSEFDRFRLYRGWIPSRFAEVAERRFCFVHIDVDLYQPTYDSLEFFYPRMVPGGIIVCDDYGFSTCPGANSAFGDFLTGKPEAVIHLTTGQGLLVKQ
jgi:O-methyltransferase